MLRSKGKVSQLEHLLEKQSLLGQTGIAHTRWATHGKPSKKMHTLSIAVIVYVSCWVRKRRKKL